VPKRRKLWDVTNMTEAMKAMESKKMNVSEASREYSVPRKSLENRIKKRVVHGTLPGPRRVLNDEEDQALVEYMKYMARGGFPMTRKITCTYAWAIAKHIPTTKAIDTYDVLSGSSDEEDDACFLCGRHSLQS